MPVGASWEADGSKERGWTLQELLAPSNVPFYDLDSNRSSNNKSPTSQVLVAIICETRMTLVLLLDCLGPLLGRQHGLKTGLTISWVF